MKNIVRASMILLLCTIMTTGACAEGMTALSFEGFTCYLWDSWHYFETKTFNESTRVTYTKSPGTRLDDIFVIQYAVADSAELLYDHGDVTESIARSVASTLCDEVYALEMLDINGTRSALVIGSYPTTAHNYHVILITRKDNVGVVLRLGVTVNSEAEARRMMTQVLYGTHE